MYTVEILFQASLLIRILRRMPFEQHTKQSVCFSFTAVCVASLSYAHVTKISLEWGGRSHMEIFQYSNSGTVQNFM